MHFVHVRVAISDRGQGAWYNSLKEFNIDFCARYIVEPPNRGHFGTAGFVLSSEVVLFSEVV